VKAKLDVSKSSSSLARRLGGVTAAADATAVRQRSAPKMTFGKAARKVAFMNGILNRTFLRSQHEVRDLAVTVRKFPCLDIADSLFLNELLATASVIKKNNRKSPLNACENHL
jgi:hypothetical protein